MIAKANKTNNFDLVIKSKQNNFIIKPQCAIWELSAGANRLLDFFIAVSMNKEKSYYSMEKVSKILDLSDKTYKKYIKELVDLKYIERKRRFGNSSITYILEKKSPNIITVINYIREKNNPITGGKNTLLNNNKLNNNNQSASEEDNIWYIQGILQNTTN